MTIDTFAQMFDRPTAEGEAATQQTNTQKPDEVAALKEQLARMQTAQEEERRRNTELMAQLFQGRGDGGTVLQQPQPASGIELDFSGLPDPRDDFEGYQKGLAERLGSMGAQMRQQITSEIVGATQTQQQVDALQNEAWERFGKNHADLAGFPEIVQIAVGQVAQDLGRRNVDPMSLLRTNMDDYVSRVAEKAGGLVRKIRGDNDDEGGADPGRTSMLDGAGPKPRGKPDPAKAPAQGQFVSSIKQLQKELGIY